jgi:membrane protein DedA with SNARE-associated domain
VLFGRFLALLRTFAAFLAGMNRMPWRRFFVSNTAGGVLWAGLWSYAKLAACAAAEEAALA